MSHIALQKRMTLLKTQRGAIGIFTMLTLLMAVLFAALAVDTGRLLMEQRRLQSVADMAALDAASAAGSCGSGNLSDAESVAAASATRNNHSGLPLDVDVGTISVGAGGVREFSETTATLATAVSVTASKTVPASLFAGGMIGTNTTLNANAVAERQAIAGFSAGTTLVSLSNSEAALLNNLFTGILGAPVALDVLSYQGIAATQLSLLELVNASADAGTVSELLTSDLSLLQLFNLYADAVSASDVADVGVANGMDALIAATVGSLNANVGDILDVTSQNPEDAANAELNLFDLIMTSALVANGTAAIDLPLAVNLPAGLLNTTTQLTVTQAPQIAIGPPGRGDDGNWRTQMRTSQVNLQTNVQSNINLTILGLAGVNANVDLALQVQVAQGQAWLQSIQCARVNDNNSVVTIGAQPGVAAINLGEASDPAATSASISVSANVLLLGNVPVADVAVGLNAPLQNPSSASLEYLYNPNNGNVLPQVQTATTAPGLAISNIPQNLTVQVTPLGLPIDLGGLGDAIVGQILTPLISALGTTLIDPLLSLLGIEIGSMDVRLVSVDIQRPEMKR